MALEFNPLNYRSRFKPGDRVRVNKEDTKKSLKSVRDITLTVKTLKHVVSHYWVVYFEEEFEELKDGVLDIILTKVNIVDERKSKISSLNL